MGSRDYDFRESGGAPIKAYTTGVSVEPDAVEQVRRASRLPFVQGIALMPDCHIGIGATIGSVIASKGAIVPAAVGVDIGCGMMAVKTTLRAEHLPDNLHQTRLDIEAAVPHGRTDNGGANDRGAWGEIPPGSVSRYAPLAARYDAIIAKHPKAKAYNSARHLGTLGTGNHFIELCLDEAGDVWVMLHSGSRGAGNKIGMYFIEKAKEEMRRYFIDKFLPDQDLAYLVDHTEIFDDYVEAVHWAQDFALENRMAMMDAVLRAMCLTLPPFEATDMAVNCHHNYVARENHFGANVLVTRKGAVRAREGDLGIIPGSMGTGSFIVRGKGNAEAFHSCSHGAGRAMSRGAAKKSITMEMHAEAMNGIEARLDADVIDESPAAYKNINAVMAAQTSLVDIVHRLHQVLNVKG